MSDFMDEFKSQNTSEAYSGKPLKELTIKDAKHAWGLAVSVNIETDVNIDYCDEWEDSCYLLYVKNNAYWYSIMWDYKGTGNMILNELADTQVNFPKFYKNLKQLGYEL